MASTTISDAKQPAEILDAPQSGCDRKVDPRSTPDQGPHRFHLSVQRRCVECTVGVRSVIAKQVDQWLLQATFTWYAACRDQHERLVKLGTCGPGLQNGRGHIDNVRRQLAV